MKKKMPFKAIHIFQALLFAFHSIPVYAKIEVSESGEDMTESIGVASAFFLWGVSLAGVLSVTAGVYKIVIGLGEDHNPRDISTGLKMVFGGIAGISIVWVLKQIGILT